MEYTVKVDKRGIVCYYKSGTEILHREDGPAVVYNNGSQEWYMDGKLHREDGPASVSYDGTKRWFKEGKLHREDGPAVVYPDGRQLWLIDGKKLSREEFDDRTKEDMVRTFIVPAGTKEIRIQFE